MSTTEINFTLNGEIFNIAEYDLRYCNGGEGWAWTHWTRDNRVIAEADECFATAAEAQQDAMRYLREKEAEEAEEQEEEARRMTPQERQSRAVGMWKGEAA
jgi:hypothetical protein